MHVFATLSHPCLQNNVMGDEIMATFSAPLAHEDHARISLLAAVE